MPRTLKGTFGHDMQRMTITGAIRR